MSPIELPQPVRDALVWILEILCKHQVPFQISGGLAAKVYGSSRPINDIDIDLPEAFFEKILPDVKAYITQGPAQYNNGKWDLYLMTLDYNGQEIDLGGLACKIYDDNKEEWRDFSADLSTASIQTIAGLDVPVMAKKALREYKLLLGGEHQRIDCRALA